MTLRCSHWRFGFRVYNFRTDATISKWCDSDSQFFARIGLGQRHISRSRAVRKSESDSLHCERAACVRSHYGSALHFRTGDNITLFVVDWAHSPSLDAARHSVVIVFLVFIANSNDRTRTKRYWQKAQETLATIANRMQQITSDALTHSLQPTQYAATVCAVRRRENIIRLKIISLFANWFHLANRVTEGSIGDNSIDWTDARDLLHKFHYRFRSTVADRTDEVPIRIAMAM